MKTLLFRSLFAGLLLGAASSQGAVVALVEANGDAGRFAQLEPEMNGTPAEGTLFGEDAWMFTDRTHEYNGAAFDASGNLLATQGGAVPATIIGLPTYLVGNPYIANANNHRDNAAYSLTLTLDAPSVLYLLIDNRLGDNVNATPPTLGSGGAGLMAWVADMGFEMVNTGISPNGQPDFVGADEGGSLSASLPDQRTHGSANLGTGAGQALNQFSTVYRKEFGAGEVRLGEQNGGGLNMYGVVITPVPEPSTYGLIGLGLVSSLVYLRRRQRR